MKGLERRKLKFCDQAGAWGTIPSWGPGRSRGPTLRPSQDQDNLRHTKVRRHWFRGQGPCGFP